METQIEIRSASVEDVAAISAILSDWLNIDEVTYYTEQISRILSEPHKPKYDSHYYVAEINNLIVGIAGYRELQPKLKTYAATSNPAELCMLYVAKEHCRRKGIGKSLLNHIENLTKRNNYTELIVRSADKFRNTGWGFYDHLGLDRVGELKPPDSKTYSQIWTRQLK